MWDYCEGWKAHTDPPVPPVVAPNSLKWLTQHGKDNNGRNMGLILAIGIQNVLVIQPIKYAK